jgi:methyl-accepting chemotaxis protein
MFSSRLSLTTQFLILLLIVLLLNATAYLFIMQNMYKQELEAQAKTVVDNVESFGTWVSQSGRVWVKGDSKNFLSKEEVISATDPEKRFHIFSKNPALATREYSEVVAESKSPAKFRMTSSNVMNPANAPDPFEVRALAAVADKQKVDYSEFSDDTYRYAKAVIHKESCIACHGDPAKAPADVLSVYGNEHGFGFKTGDVAGVISVTLPKRNIFESAISLINAVEMAVIFLSILPMMWFIRRAIILPIKQITHAADEISRGKDVHVDVTDTVADTKNEIHTLKIATARMRNSFIIAVRKMREARKNADQMKQMIQDKDKK